MNLILLRPSEIGPDGRATLRDERARHVIKVLHAAVGQTLVIGQLDGPTGQGVVEAVDAETVTLGCTLEDPPGPVPRTDLLLAMPRPKVMKRLWAQLAAMGVGRIMVTNAWKVERCYFDTHVLDPAFYTPLLIEGLQQACDTRLPEVSVHRRFKAFVEDELDVLSPSARRVVLEPCADTHLADLPTTADERLLLALGPEGGWTAYELDLIHAHSFVSASLGQRTLRTDTACIAAMAVAEQMLAPLV